MSLAGTTSQSYCGIDQSIASRSLNTIQSFQLSLFITSPNHNTIHKVCTELELLAAAPNLHHISIHLNFSLHYQFPTGALLELDRLLTGLGFRQLNSIGFHINGCTPPEWVEGYEPRSYGESRVNCVAMMVIK